MRERPLCIFCLLFLIVQVVLIRGFRLAKDWNPSQLEKTVEEGSVITASGVVKHTEIKKENLVVYLTAKTYQTNIIVYIKQENASNGQIRIGNEIKVTGEVAYFDEPRNPGNFNQKFFYQKQGIHGSIFASNYQIVNSSHNIWKESLAQLRIHWKGILIQTLGETDGNTMSAILLGDKSELDGDLKELYQKNGIGHILAISGLHMTFIGLGFYKLLRKWGLSFVSAGIIGIIFLISYAIMIGNGVASMRALVMFIVRIGADMTGRVYDMLTALALAAIVILIWRPLYLYDAGFLLSFGAILGILLVHPILELKTKKESSIAEKAGRNLWNGVWGSLSINLMILPCMLYFYFEFPLYSLFLNLLVIPLMSVVLGTGVIGSSLYHLIPMIGTGVLCISKPVLFLYEYLCDICIRMPGSHVIIGQPEIWQMVAYYTGLGIVLVVLRQKRELEEEQRVEVISVDNPRGASCFLLVMFLNVAVLCIHWGTLLDFQRGVSITMLDVGQGDGLVIQEKGGMVCMVDGGSSDVSEVGKYRMEPYLKSQGIGTVDYAFISHGDSDHYNGVEEMLKRQSVGVRIRCLVLPSLRVQDEKLKALAAVAIENGVQVVTIHEKESVIGDSGAKAMKLTCIAPTEEYEGAIGNASSMVLALSYGTFDMLFTGDVEDTGEEILTDILTDQQTGTQREGKVQYEVLKVAHHGSKNSSEQEFLEAVDPQIALISAGQNNRYGHPHEETIQKLIDRKCNIENTQEKGAIVVETDGNRIVVREYMKR